jgi:hypothetical protein
VVIEIIEFKYSWFPYLALPLIHTEIVVTLDIKKAYSEESISNLVPFS